MSKGWVRYIESMVYDPNSYQEEYYEADDGYYHEPNFFDHLVNFFQRSWPAIKSGIYNFFYHISRYWK